MIKLLLVTSTFCCNGKSADSDTKEQETNGFVKLVEEDETFMTWVMKHHIKYHYSEKCEMNMIRKETAATRATKDEENLDTASSNNDEKEYSIGKPEFSSSKVPQLNFDELNKLNYDSERENYHNIEDKLKKIKKRFDLIKEQK